VVGTVFEGYRILERLDGPGYADLYVAADEHGREHLLYVREEPPEGFTTRVGQLRLLTELLPRLVGIRGGGVRGSVGWVATERRDGPSMEGLLSAPDPKLVPLILEEAAEYAEVLKTAHQLGFIHGDLCLDHILVSEEHKFRIAALGFTELFGMTAAMAEKRPEYRAPEQFFEDVTLDPRADVYSLGMVLYALIGCQRPFAGHSGDALFECALTATPEPLETLLPLPASVSALVAKATAKRPEARHQSMEELLSELRAAMEDCIAGAGSLLDLDPAESSSVPHHDTSPSPGPLAPLALRPSFPSSRPTLPSARMVPPRVPSLEAPPPAGAPLVLPAGRYLQSTPVGAPRLRVPRSTALALTGLAFCIAMGARLIDARDPATLLSHVPLVIVPAPLAPSQSPAPPAAPQAPAGPVLHAAGALRAPIPAPTPTSHEICQSTHYDCGP
jgi:serine/threonine protein kinase